MPLIIVIFCLLVVVITVAGSEDYPWIYWVLIPVAALLICGLSLQLIRDANKPYMRLKVSKATYKKK